MLKFLCQCVEEKTIEMAGPDRIVSQKGTFLYFPHTRKKKRKQRVISSFEKISLHTSSDYFQDIQSRMLCIYKGMLCECVHEGVRVNIVRQ